MTSIPGQQQPRPHKGGEPGLIINMKEPHFEENVDDMMNKVFSYQKEPDWILSDFEIDFNTGWKDKALQEIKESLNAVKSKLNSIDIQKWHSHTTRTNLAGEAIVHLRRNIQPELCTQAWCKFYEILSKFSVVPLNDDKDFNSLHLCEAPGAFITALGHFRYCNRLSSSWQWLATTLNPYYEGNSLGMMVDDDRFILNTMDNWYFGKDNSGDLMKLDNITGLQEMCRLMGRVHLVTADGSINCSNMPEEQEEVVAALHLAEVAVALSILESNGTFVVKMFTLFEHSSVSMMYMLAVAFRDVHVFKPATSKSGNSEVYVVCLGYVGLDSTIVDQLIAQVSSSNSSPLLVSSIPESFLHQHRNCCRYFADRQIQTIEKNLALFFDYPVYEEQYITMLRQYFARSFVYRLKIRSMPNDLRLSGEHERVKRMFFNSLRLTGSYEDRQRFKRSWEEQLLAMEVYDYPLRTRHCIENDLDETNFDISGWSIVEGLRPGSIKSSRFCDVSLLQQYNLLADKCHVDTKSDRAFLDLWKCEMESDLVPGDQMSELEMRLWRYIPVKIIGNELSDTAVLLDAVLGWLQTAKTGEHLGLIFCGIFSRFTAAVIYLIFCLHKRIVILDDAAGDTTKRLLVAHHFLGCPAELIDYLRAVSNILDSMKNLDQTVLQFIPVTTIFQHSGLFRKFLHNVNGNFLKRRINFLHGKELERIAEAKLNS